MKKIVIALGILACAGLGSYTVWEVLQTDREAPVISFPDEEKYVDYFSEADLLDGVHAEDGRDGDVTDSLAIESVSYDDGKEIVLVTYAARDKNNNIAKASRILNASTANVSEDEKEGGDAKEGASAAADREKKAGTEAREHELKKNRTDSGASDAEKEQSNSERESELESESETDTETESESETLSVGSPVIRLRENRVKIQEGGDFTPLDYVASVEDDYDNIYALWRDIQVTGDYDIQKAGTYELTYYVTDSSGNQSNRARLKLTVEKK